MGEWGNTTYVHDGDVRRVATAVKTLFARDGYAEVDVSPRKMRALLLRLHRGTTSRDVPLWGALLAPGAPGWTIVQTTPLEVLGEPDPEEKAPRCALLSRLLGCESIQFNLYDGSSGGILVEATPSGQFALSGFNAYSDEGELFFNGLEIEKRHLRAAFRLLDPPDAAADLPRAVPAHTMDDVVAAAVSDPGCWEFAERLGVALGGPNARFWTNEHGSYLEYGKAFDVPGGRLMYFHRRPSPGDPDPADAGPRYAGEALRAVICTDDSRFAEIVRAALLARGHSAERVTSPDDALAKLDLQMVDLVIATEEAGGKGLIDLLCERYRPFEGPVLIRASKLAFTDDPTPPDRAGRLRLADNWLPLPLTRDMLAGVLNMAECNVIQRKGTKA